MDTASFFVPLMIFHQGLTVLTDYSSPQGTPDLRDVSAAGRFHGFMKIITISRH